jgi:branched-chain amino acid transport system ATP-binding protein
VIAVHPDAQARGTCLLRAEGLSAGYHGHPVVRDLDLEVGAGEVVALLGSNGAGKTTTLMTLAGQLPSLGGVVSLFGRPTTAALHSRARAGLSLVTQDRGVFTRLTTAENLRLGRGDTARALELFPELERLLGRTVGQLSGGEQQMLTLGRALSRRPRLLLADELSLGLAPLVVGRLLHAVRQAAREDGVGALLVEQHVARILRIADRVYVLRRGTVVLSGGVDEVGPKLEETYLAEGPATPSVHRQSENEGAP